MSVKKIREKNSQQFIDDLKKVSGVMVWAQNTDTFLSTTKKELREEAETMKIHYYITDRIFKVKRDVMVVI